MNDDFLGHLKGIFFAKLSIQTYPVQYVGSLSVLLVFYN